MSNTQSPLPFQVVSAPTGSGKTGVMELAMLRLLYRHIQSDGQLLSPKGRTKIIYLAPIRALVQERVADWGNRFGLLGLLCMELSGDADAERADLEAADIICTTPEKFGRVCCRVGYALLLQVTCHVASKTALDLLQMLAFQGWCQQLQ